MKTPTTVAELAEALRQYGQFKQAIVEAMFAALTPNVEVRITFDRATDALEGPHMLAAALDGLGLFDGPATSKAMRVRDDKTTGVYELKNGSCIKFVLADKVYF